MLEYDRIDVSEGIETNKTGSSRGCIICHYWYFFKINCKFQPKVCGSFHDMTKKCLNFIDVGKNNIRLIFGAW